MYRRVINHCDRCAILFIIDCSLSMKEITRYGYTEMPKIDAAAFIVNFMIEELLARATRYANVRDYYDIGVIGYSGNEAFSLLDNSDYERVFMNTPRIADTMPQPRGVEINVRDYDGTIHTETFNTHFWADPTASGASPLYDALVMTKGLIEAWCNDPKNKSCFAPMIFHFGDGLASDAEDSDVLQIADETKAISLNGENTILFNVYFSTLGEGEANAEIYPVEKTFATSDRDKEFMYRMSSPLPREITEDLPLLHGIYTQSTRRAVAFNTTPISMLSLLCIGTLQPRNIINCEDESMVRY